MPNRRRKTTTTTNPLTKAASLLGGLFGGGRGRNATRSRGGRRQTEATGFSRLRRSARR